LRVENHALKEALADGEAKLEQHVAAVIEWTSQ